MKIHIEKKVSVEEVQNEFMETVISSIKNLEKDKTKKTDFSVLEAKIKKLKNKLATG